MATRRPRVKVTANLSIRRPPKLNTSNVAVDSVKQEDVQETCAEPAKEVTVAGCALPTSVCEDAVAEEIVQTDTLPAHKPAAAPSEKPFQDFKLPKPVDDVVKLSCPEPSANLTNTSHSGDEPMSPRKQDSRPPFPLPLARKRNRTESLTSNKSLPEGVTVNKVTRKVATKQEESQRTLENKKEIRKRLTNIENVNKQNLTMFDMIYYNPINNPMTPPALSKRGSLENIPKSVDGHERDGVRSRSVSKSRSPTPAPSGSMAVPTQKPAAPVQLTPQLKLGPNGEMILDEASLVIENEREKEMRETLANTDIVYQDEYSGNSGYYSRIRRTKDWTDEETIRFYRCLHTIGTDFSMMLSMFPQRSRRDLKLKFKKEERLNLSLVNKALLHPKAFNVEELQQQFAEEDEELERHRQEEKQRKLEAMEQQHKEQLRKKVLLQMSTSSSPQRRLSKSERVMTDGSEPLGEDMKKPKRKASPRKRSTAKPANTTLPSIADVQEEEKEQQQQESETIAKDNTTALLCSSENSPVISSIVPKENIKQRKRTPTPKKGATAKLDSSIKAELKVEQQVDYAPEHNDCITVNAEIATENIPVDEASFKKENRIPAPNKRDTAKLASAKVTSAMLQEEQQQHHSVAIPDHYVPPHCINAEASNNTPVNIAMDNATSVVSFAKPSALDRPTGKTSPAQASSNVVEQQVEGTAEDNVLMLMEERKNTPTHRRPQHRGPKKHWRALKRKRKGKRHYARKSNSASKGTDTLQPLDCAVAIKQDVTEIVPSIGGPFGEPNVAVTNNPNEPFVSYEPAADTYDNVNIDLPIVKYQCMDDIEVNGYQISDEIMDTAGYDADGRGNAAASTADAIVPDQEDDSITVITLQNLDDQTHTTCIRTDVGQSVEATTINELTPVDIKYDEYDPSSHLVLSCGESTSKEELCSGENQNTSATREANTDRSAPGNVQLIDWPAVVVPTTEPIPYIVYEKLEYGSSSGTVIIPDLLPDKVAAIKEQPAQYTAVAQGAGNVPMPVQQSSSAATLVPAVNEGKQTSTSCYTTIAASNPTHKMIPNAAPHEDQALYKYHAYDTGVPAKEVENVKEQEQEQEEEELEEENDGFSLEDIDINSLVLVESQDSVDPSRTFYEIYVSNPDTGQLSEKPLDVPADVIESIRQILEASGER
uniref:Myb-like domain-containing protein n=1 Tax=Anopheles minimus TaxID=112268 RepID=A0A182WFC9_9DIPT